MVYGYLYPVVPPLEGFLRQYIDHGIDRAYTENIWWISVISLPDFLTADAFARAVEEVTKKRRQIMACLRRFSICTDFYLCLPAPPPLVLPPPPEEWELEPEEYELEEPEEYELEELDQLEPEEYVLEELE